MSPPRILLSIPQSPLDPSSGAAASERTTCEMLARAGWQVRVVGTTACEAHRTIDHPALLGELGISFRSSIQAGSISAALTYSHRGVDYQLADAGGKTVDEARQSMASDMDALIHEELTARAPDIFLTYGSNESEVARRAAARRAGSHVVFSVHNYAYMHPRAFESVDSILAPSRHVADYYRTEQDADVTALPPPVAVDDVLAPFTSPLFFTLINPTIQKGILHFLCLAELSLQRCPETQFLIVESRGSAEAIAAAAKVVGVDLSSLTNLHVAKVTPNVSDIYAMTRVLLMPSLIEPAGRAVVEAQLNRIPVVASDHGGLPEMVGEGGWVLPVGTENTPIRSALEPWMELVERLHRDPEFYAQSSQAAWDAASPHRTGKVELERVGYFRSLLNRPRTGVSAAPGVSKHRKRRLLFLSPTMPSQTGHGAAMRAGAMLEALSADLDISLAVAENSHSGRCRPVLLSQNNSAPK